LKEHYTPNKESDYTNKKEYTSHTFIRTNSVLQEQSRGYVDKWMERQMYSTDPSMQGVEPVRIQYITFTKYLEIQHTKHIPRTKHTTTDLITYSCIIMLCVSSLHSIF